MNKILPKKYDEFLEKGYWDKFFNKLKKNSDLEYFEWYGEYKDFSSIMEHSITKNDRILNIGCGKSLLSEQMYDKGYENIVNIDFSDKVIQEMTARSKDKRPKMVYEVMDIFNMKYPDSSFDTILDKGALDALFPKDTPENCNNIQTLFKEIERILNEKGRYVCISLLQAHILRELLAYFTPKNYEITITEFLIKKSKLFPYLVSLTKTANPNNDRVTLSLKNENNEKAVLNSVQVSQKIRETQTYSLFMSDIRNLRQGQRVSIDIWDEKRRGDTNVPRYTIILCDSPDSRILSQKSCGCFIVPQGRESSWLFSAEQGNFELLSQTNMSRLLIAVLNPGHDFVNLKLIQEELSEVVPGLVPKDCSNPKIPFMTDGDEIGERAILLEDSEMFVEEHTMEDEMTYRSLILKSNLSQIQSQGRLKYYDATERLKTTPQAEELTKLSLLPNKKGRVVGIDETYLAFECHRLIIAGLGFISKKLIEKKELKVLILGQGAGIMSKFFYYNLPNVSIEAVEISEKIIEVGKKYFEWPTDERHKVIHGDALQYVKDLIAKHSQETKPETSENNTSEPQDNVEEKKDGEEKATANEQSASSLGLYDVIMIDINDPSPGSKLNPPKEFIEQEFLVSLKRLLTDSGALMMNIIPNETGALDSCLKDINKVFDVIYLAKPETEANYVAFMLNVDLKRDKSQDGSELIIVGEGLIPSKKDIETAFKGIMKSLPVKWDSTMNLDQYCGEIALKYPQMRGNAFKMTNVHVTKGDAGEYTNKTKEMYLEDKEKVDKSQRKKKKNKKR